MSRTLNITQLSEIAAGLNIEGGDPQKDLIKANPNGLWVNMILILDRPLVDNIIFDDILKHNTYPLLENALDDLNEHKFLAAFLLTALYYIDNAFELINKQNIKITIHFHQDKLNGEPLIKLFKYHLDYLTNKFNYNMHAIELEFRTDNQTYVESTHNYTNTDILLSFSQCAGLDSKLAAGELIIPNEFIPYNIDNKTIYESKIYKINNHLINTIDNILNFKYHYEIIQYINEHYKSNNLNKKFMANHFNINNFYKTRILQVNKLWNPTDKNELIIIN